MKKLAVISVFVFVVMGFVGGVQAYTVTTYSQYFDWYGDIDQSDYVNENFEDATLQPGLSITEVGGNGIIDAGVYWNIVDAFGTGRYQIFNYAPGMYAFGGFFNLADTVHAGGPGSSINVYINDDNTLAMNIPSSALGEFYGFITDGVFTGVRFEDGDGAGGAIETYYSIDLSLATAVPEPTSLLLLGLGMMGIGFFSRRNRKS